MPAFVDKAQAPNSSGNRSTPSEKQSDKTSSRFLDNRTDATTQRKQQAIATNNSQTKRAYLLQAMIANSPRMIAQRQQIQNISSPPIQRALDGGGRVENGDKGGINNWLAGNGYDNPNLFSAANYAALTPLYNTLIAADDAYDPEAAGDIEAQAKNAIQNAYEALLEAAGNAYLEEGEEAWNTAVEAGADRYELHVADGYAAAAAFAWPGIAALPAEFTAAVQTTVEARVAAAEEARIAAVNAAYQAYRANDRLLAGTIAAIRLSLGNDASVDEVNERLTLVYQRQCTITRQNWLTHLGVAGNAINGNNNLHYTTFNNSVTTAAGLRVDNRSEAQLRTALFETAAWYRRLHATHVVGDERYHKYWGGRYSANVAAAADYNTATLDGEYTRMVNTITALVTSAKSRHGRVAANNNGQQNNVDGEDD